MGYSDCIFSVIFSSLFYQTNEKIWLMVRCLFIFLNFDKNTLLVSYIKILLGFLQKTTFRFLTKMTSFGFLQRITSLLLIKLLLSFLQKTLLGFLQKTLIGFLQKNHLLVSYKTHFLVSHKKNHFLVFIKNQFLARFLIKNHFSVS